MNSYALRVDLANVSAVEIADFVKKSSVKYFYALEDLKSDNPHLQAYLEASIKMQALRVKFKRKFPTLVGNGSYSIKSADYRSIRYLAYLTKQGDYEHNLPEELVKDAIKVNSDIQKNKKKSVITKLEEYCSEELKKHGDDYSSVDDEELMKKIIQYHLDNNLLVRRYNIVTYYHTLLCRASVVSLSQMARLFMEHNVP